MRTRLLVTALAWLLATTAVNAQPDASGTPESATTTVTGEVVAGVTYVAASDLAVALGDVVTAAAGVLTWRGSEGVATFFLGAADALLQKPLDGGPGDWAMAAPPLLVDGGVATDPAAWLLPLDAVQLLGVAAVVIGDQVYLQLPSGFVVGVEVGGDASATSADASGTAAAPGSGGSELTEVAGVPALRFFVDGDLSLLLLDLDLAPLAYPELTAVVDDAAARAGSDQALLALVTALEPRDWSPSLVFTQGQVSTEVRSPYRFHLYLGEEGAVSASAPVAGVILLPTTFSLYLPITVSWAGQTATVTFRR